ncbi:MAG: hypothetical protein INH12_26010 [Cupriavidus sp.]|nr:hypothetical protein [Cupriavidus sp.]QWE97866.1 hypothetical protein KLP38_23200 [Cupriavidus sp. EM10]MCA3193535.1 hypothetical protein [Cupriavidus sp.]MCA3199005.1 hypothetical protein [Cupriavidus sp.]MCA3203412.1 hypothetical protein [Cupriavidus sp.]
MSYPRFLPCLLAPLLWLPATAALAEGDPNLVQCQRINQAQLRSASEETLLFLRCRARQISYDAPRLRGVTQKFRDDLVFACLDQADEIEHQLRVGHGYTRETLARKKCDQ